MKKTNKKVDKKLNLLSNAEPIMLDLTQSFDVPEDISGEELKEDMDINYQANISAIEQDLQEVTQKDRLTEAYEQLYSDKNIEKITDISPNDLGKISILLTYARQFKFRELESLILNNMRLRVSLKRQGREEHVKISQAEVLRDINQLKLAHKLDNRVNKG